MEKRQIKRCGSSLAVMLNRGSLEVYDLKEGSDVEVHYEYPVIIIKPVEANANANANAKSKA
jgi:antitoxin component of MazEF toxin-antitoxin module